MTILLRRIDLGSAAGPHLAGGVIKASVLASADAARDVVEQAQHEAARLLEEAHAQAEGHLAQHQARLERQMWQHAADYAESMGREWDRSLADLEKRLAALVGSAVRKLLEKAPPDKRLRACVRQLVAQAGAPDSGMLLVAEEDYDTVTALADTLPWPVQRSREVAPGTARLASLQGRWECDIHGALERVLEALGTRTEQHEENHHG